MNALKFIVSEPWLTTFDLSQSGNDTDAFVPELWAMEGLLVLENEMIAGQLVHRDFSNTIQRWGDVVNTRRPGKFYAKRKVDGQQVTKQAVNATNVQVKLDQHLHTSFLVYDGEEAKGFNNLVEEYLTPAVISIARGIDEIICMQAYNFMAYSVGQLGVSPTKSTVIAVGTQFDTNAAPTAGRNFLITPGMKDALLNIDDFVQADKVGDDGTAMREASLGRKFALNTFMTQNLPSIATGQPTTAGQVNNVAGYAAGDTSITVDVFAAGEVVVGSWLTISGDDTPQKVVAINADPATLLTLSPGLKRAVVDDAAITVVTPGAVNQPAPLTYNNISVANGYPNCYAEQLEIDGFTADIQRGQLVSFGVDPVINENQFGALSLGPNDDPQTTLLLDRPLFRNVANDEVVATGPAGEYGFAFLRDAIALVSRPLPTPIAGTGARSFVQSMNNLSIRVTITYDGDSQAHLVTVDLLCGVKTLDERLGVVVYG